MQAGALATVPQVKTWLGIDASNTTDDVLLQRLVNSASAFVYSYLSILTFAKTQYDEMYDGHGGSFMVLRQQPAIDILAVAGNGSPISAATGDGRTSPLRDGYKLIGQNLTLFGRVFPHCRSSVYVSYHAGYWASAEAQKVEATNHTADTDRTWIADEGVTLEDGTPLTKVDAAPTTLQYTVSEEGLYTFNTARDNQIVLISYSYVPADVNEAVIELVGERYKYKDRIGYASKSLAGQEVVSFQSNNIPQYILNLLNKYIRVVPV